MKKNRYTSRLFAAVTSAAMLCACVPAFSVSADNAPVLGDIDGDGVITGHDTAMISGHLYLDSFTLTDEQLARADINQDGQVDANDAILLHEQEVYPLGDLDLDGYVSTWDALYTQQLLIEENLLPVNTEFVNQYSQVQRNLIDMDLNGVLTFYDFSQVLSCYGFIAAGSDSPFSYCHQEGCFYGHYDTNMSRFLGDVDEDGVITDHDAAILSRFAKMRTSDCVPDIFNMVQRGDMNQDGRYDNTDADIIHQMAKYTFGQTTHSDSDDTSSAQIALQINAIKMAGGTVVNDSYDKEYRANYEDYKKEALQQAKDGSPVYFIKELDYNLLDCDGDGNVDMADAVALLQAYSRDSAGGSYYPYVGQYILH